MRQLNAAAKVAGELTPERRQLLAMRAAFGLRYGELLFPGDPLGDLERSATTRSVAAELDRAGLQPR